MVGGDKLKRKRGRPFKTPIGNASNFFKVILHQTLEEKKLKMPDKFVRKYGSQLVSPVVNLVDPSGRSWEVGLTRDVGNIWLDHSWSDFAEFYSINYGHFLVFQYDGNSNFDVLVFDRSTCDIDYLRRDCERKSVQQKKRKQHKSVPEYLKAKKKRTNIDLDDDEEEEDKSNVEAAIPKDMDGFHCDKLKITIPTPSDGTGNGKSGGGSSQHIEIYVSRKFGSKYSSAERDRAVRAAKTIRPQNPSFLVIMRSNLANGIMYVPRTFSDVHLSGISGNMATIVDGHRRKWPVVLSRRLQGGFNVKEGWTSFSRDAKLKVGDICIFELIKVGGSELRVFTFRA